MRLIVCIAIAGLLGACSATSPLGLGPSDTSVLSNYAGQGPAAAALANAGPGGPALGAVVDSGGLGDILTVGDRELAAQAQERALNASASGASVTWRNPQSNVRGEVTPGPLYSVNLQECRTFTHAVEVSRQRYVMRGTACKQDSSGWTVLG